MGNVEDSDDGDVGSGETELQREARLVRLMKGLPAEAPAAQAASDDEDDDSDNGAHQREDAHGGAATQHPSSPLYGVNELAVLLQVLQQVPGPMQHKLDTWLGSGGSVATWCTELQAAH